MFAGNISIPSSESYLTTTVSAWSLYRKLPHFHDYYTLLLGIILLYYPVLSSVLGGQNTTITLLLFVVVWCFGQSGKEWLAGFFLGLMLFKPQFGIPLICLHFLAGRWRTVLSSIATGAILYLVTAQFFGFFWIRDWLAYASWVSTIAAAIDGANSICWLGFFQSILGVQSKLALGIGLFMTSATIMGIAVVWFRARHKSDLSAEFALASVGLILIQPHAMYYDMGLVLFAYLMISCYRRKNVKDLILLWILAIIQVSARPLGFSPLFFLLLWSGFLGIRSFFNGPVEEDAQHTGDSVTDY